MKKIIGIVFMNMVFISTSFAINIEKISGIEKSFSCSTHEKDFSVSQHTFRSTYMPHDSLHIGAWRAENIILSLLSDKEKKNIKLLSGSRRVYIRFGTGNCIIDETSQRVVTCELKSRTTSSDVDSSLQMSEDIQYIRPWMFENGFAQMKFSYSDVSAEGDPQVITVNRDFIVKDLNLTVDMKEKKDFKNDPVQRAILNLTGTALIGGVEKSFSISEQDLGEWIDDENRSHWNRCLVNQ